MVFEFSTLMVKIKPNISQSIIIDFFNDVLEMLS